MVLLAAMVFIVLIPLVAPWARRLVRDRVQAYGQRRAAARAPQDRDNGQGGGKGQDPGQDPGQDRGQDRDRAGV